ncbi:hypothetical protein BTUL_0030g00500 [Botrytis tulipae]|uniref:EF-hand domain-containing protein n=1 Tax=Botrytis tulipae TaxID=87230 RepID=A0A4Z1F0M9_9HELO|nr:hypothetical protein BTUL_0030g00500 [Botrytis tulipae]
MIDAGAVCGYPHPTLRCDEFREIASRSKNCSFLLSFSKYTEHSIIMAKPLSDEEVAILKEAFDAYIKGASCVRPPTVLSGLMSFAGNITVEEFGRVMKQSGQNPSEEELAQIIKEVDLDGDGTINFDGMIP